MAKRSKKSRMFESNRNARIAVRSNSASTIVTETKYRDEGSLVAEVQSKSLGRGATRLFIRDAEGKFLALNGREARTVYRALQTHFAFAERTW